MRSLCAVVILAIAALCGCGTGRIGGVSSNGGGDSVQVVVTPGSATVYQGQSLQFHAQVLATTDQSVTWSIQQGIGTIDSTGRYTAPTDSYGGAFHVVATSQSDRKAQGYAVVSVAPIQVTVSPESITLPPGGSTSFTAKVAGLPNTTVSWAVLEPGGGSVTGTGSYTAPSTTGFFHLVATSIMDSSRSGSATIAVTTSSGRFTPTGDTKDPRIFHTATLLSNGHVLVAGGAHRADRLCFGGISSAEIYDPATGVFSYTGAMFALRYAHTATRLTNGEVLVTGGFGSGYDCEDRGEPAQSSAELYDPASGAFRAATSMTMGRGGHTATLLLNGEVLVTGGGDQGGGLLPFYGTATNTAELYDPVQGVFVRTGDMAASRLGHTASLLKSGKVLIVGGTESSEAAPTNAAEIYDPATGNFTATQNMSTPRSGHTATVLGDGRVLIAGGYTASTSDGFQATNTTEIYDPSTGAFSPNGKMEIGRFGHTATLLPNGTVLVTSGNDATAEIYDPVAGAFNPAGAMDMQGSGSATLLQNGTVLIIGGTSAELFK